MSGIDGGILRRSRNYTLVMLTAIYVINMIDRKIITILQEPIKAEFHLHDWQLGLMTGFAFAMLYAVLGVPIARLADRGGNRTAIVAASLAFWSLMTAVCGLAQNYWQLLAARLGVGVGEAGSGPASMSLIADHFSHGDRGKAMGVYALASPIGSALGLALGGQIAHLYGWRVALLVVGLPGLALAILFKFTVREPQRGQADGRAPAALERTSFIGVLKVMLRKPTYVLLMCGGCTAAFSTLGLQYWFPSFFVRSFGLSLSQVGFIWGLSAGVAGLLGSFGGGWLADKFGKKIPRAILLVPAAGMILALPFHILAVTAGNWVLALVALLVPTALNTLWVAPNMVLTQGLAPLAMRATSAAISTFVINLIGLGLGPVLLGLISDVFASHSGSAEVGLRHALLAVSPIYVISAVCFFLASRSVARDLESSHAASVK